MRLSRASATFFAAARIGRFPQMPPPFSAKKIHGRPAHELARKKKLVELKPVEIEVYDFRVSEVSGSLARVSIECAAGTYIRSLAHDMGAALGCGAHLAEIVRTAVGEFTLDHAVKLEDLEQAGADGLGNKVLVADSGPGPGVRTSAAATSPRPNSTGPPHNPKQTPPNHSESLW